MASAETSCSSSNTSGFSTWHRSAGAGAGAGAGSGADGGVAAAISPEAGTSVVCSNKLPVYFQHNGHSRTIVGIERRRPRGSARKWEYLLLLFDPSERSGADGLRRSLTQKSHWEGKIKRRVGTIARRDKYDILLVLEDDARGSDRTKFVKRHDAAALRNN